MTGIRDLTQSYMIGPISCSYFPKSSKLLLNTLGRQSQGLHLIYIMLKACRALLTLLKTWGGWGGSVGLQRKHKHCVKIISKYPCQEVHSLHAGAFLQTRKLHSVSSRFTLTHFTLSLADTYWPGPVTVLVRSLFVPRAGTLFSHLGSAETWPQLVI